MGAGPLLVWQLYPMNPSPARRARAVIGSGAYLVGISACVFLAAAIVRATTGGPTGAIGKGIGDAIGDGMVLWVVHAAWAATTARRHGTMTWGKRLAASFAAGVTTAGVILGLLRLVPGDSIPPLVLPVVMLATVLATSTLFYERCGR